MLLAGIMVLLSVALTTFVHPNFVYFTITIGMMMVQSVFTGFCPAGMILKSMDVKE
jgi:hypothetical protein